MLLLLGEWLYGVGEPTLVDSTRGISYQYSVNSLRTDTTAPTVVAMAPNITQKPNPLIRRDTSLLSGIPVDIVDGVVRMKCHAIKKTYARKPVIAANNKPPCRACSEASKKNRATNEIAKAKKLAPANRKATRMVCLTSSSLLNGSVLDQTLYSWLY